jgi:hypothetical protein
MTMFVLAVTAHMCVVPTGAGGGLGPAGSRAPGESKCYQQG